MIRSSALIAASLIILFVAAATLVTYQSTSVVAQSSSTQIVSQSYANNGQARLASVSSTTLIRSTYMLPADAAELLTKLFEHKATAMVECKTDEEGAESNNGLVKFEITAEPETQKAIEGFMAKVFPEDKVKAYTEGQTVAATKTVNLKLPNMT